MKDAWKVTRGWTHILDAIPVRPVASRATIKTPFAPRGPFSPLVSTGVRPGNEKRPYRERESGENRGSCYKLTEPPPAPCKGAAQLPFPFSHEARIHSQAFSLSRRGFWNVNIFLRADFSALNDIRPISAHLHSAFHMAPYSPLHEYH